MPAPLRFLDRPHQRLCVERREHDAADALAQEALDHLDLLLAIVLAERPLPDHAGRRRPAPASSRSALTAPAWMRLPELVRRALRDDRDLIARLVRARGARRRPRRVSTTRRRRTSRSARRGRDSRPAAVRDWGTPRRYRARARPARPGGGRGGRARGPGRGREEAGPRPGGGRRGRGPRPGERAATVRRSRRAVSAPRAGPARSGGGAGAAAADERVELTRLGARGLGLRAQPIAGGGAGLGRRGRRLRRPRHALDAARHLVDAAHLLVARRADGLDQRLHAGHLPGEGGDRPRTRARGATSLRGRDRSTPRSASRCRAPPAPSAAPGGALPRRPPRSPRPASPARAASTAALSARMLVWNAISSMVRMIRVTRELASSMPAIDATIASSAAFELRISVSASVTRRVRVVRVPRRWSAWWSEIWAIVLDASLERGRLVAGRARQRLGRARRVGGGRRSASRRCRRCPTRRGRAGG